MSGQSAVLGRSDNKDSQHHPPPRARHFLPEELEYALKRDHFDALELLKSRTQNRETENQQEKTKEKV